jgi:hypothetical protein
MALMTKGAQSRIDEVRNDLVARTAVPYRANMTAWYDAYWTNAHHGNAAAKKQLSDFLSMADVANAGDAATRAKRRLLIFLESLKFGSSLQAAKTTVTALGAPMLDGRIAPLVTRLTIQANQQNGNGELVRDKFLVELKGRPDHFLRNERLLSGNIGATTRNYFWYDYDRDQYKIDMAPPAHYPGAYGFDAVTGQDVMISTMFSGCSFCFKQENVGGRILAAHIMPDDGAGHVVSGAGTGLAQQLAGLVANVTAGNFTGSAAGNFRVYGAGYSNLAAPLNTGYPVRTTLDEFMNIVGFRNGGTWQIWSQHIRGATKTVVRLF